MKIALFFIGGQEYVMSYKDKDAFEADVEFITTLGELANDFIELDNTETEFRFRWSRLLAFSVIR